MMFKTSALVGFAAWTLVAAGTTSSFAQTDRALQEKEASEQVTTTQYRKTPPYRVGVAAGYLSNSWIVFCLQHIRYEVSLHPEIKDVIVTDAAFNPTKQAADIEDLISQNVSLILYWPVDEKAIEPALKKATSRGIGTVNTGGGFTYSPGTVSNAYIDQWALGEMVAEHLFEEMHGKGKIFAMLPIAGTTAAVDQLAALKEVMKKYPGIELLSAEYGDWNCGKSKQITENLIERYPQIDGVYSPSGIMSMGIAEALESAGRLKDVAMSPADEYNGWLKWVAQNKKAGVVTFPTRAGQVATQIGVDILAGKPIKRGYIVPSKYLSPAEVADHFVEPNRPDDWWASSLPDAFKPK